MLGLKLKMLVKRHHVSDVSCSWKLTSIDYAMIYDFRVNKLWLSWLCSDMWREIEQALIMQWYMKGESTGFDLCSDILRESQQALIMQWYMKGESTGFDLCSDILRESQQALIMQWYMKGVQLYIKGGSTSFVYAVVYEGRVNKLWFMQWYIKGESTSFDLCSDILRDTQQALIYAVIY